MSVDDFVLAGAIAIMFVVAVGPLLHQPSLHEYSWELPNAQKIIIAENVDYYKPTTVYVANFTQFQELARGTVYVTTKHGFFGASLEMIYLTGYTAYVYVETGHFKNVTVENKTVIALKQG